MKSLQPKKQNIDLKEPADVSREVQGSKDPITTSAGSPASVSPFETKEASLQNINEFMGNYLEIQKKNLSFKTLQKYNKLLSFSFTDTELADIYNEVVDSLKTQVSPTLSFAELMGQEFPKARY